MIKHLQLLELYLTNAYDLEKAKPHMRAVWIRFLIVTEIGIILTFTPAAFIASSCCLMWMVLVSIHLIPRWKECGFKVRYYFLPLLPMIIVTAVLLPFCLPLLESGWENFVVIAKNPLLLIGYVFLAFVGYGLHNTERWDTPEITKAKYIVTAATVLIALFFAIDNPLRDIVVNNLL